MKELRHAETKHPEWPADRLRQVVIVAEEAGEALRAALSIIENEEALVKNPPVGYDITLSHNKMARLEEELEKEIAQTGAMALRWLQNRTPLYAQT